MIAADNQPLSIVDNRGFKKLFKIVAPQYVLPSRNTISNLIDIKYDLYSNRIKAELNVINNICITTDTWTDTINARGYLGLTVHYVKNQNLKTFTIGLIELLDRHTAYNLEKTLREVSDQWNISKSKVVAVVADNACNISKAIADFFGKDKLVHCFAHTLQLVANKPLQKITDLNKLINLIKENVTFFKHSVNAVNELRESQTRNNVQVPLKLIQSVPTRWNSVYYQIERFLELSEYIAPILLKHSRDMPTSPQMKILQEIMNVLHPIEQITKELSGEQYVTCSKIIPIVNGLKFTLNKTVVVTPIGIQAKELVLKEINDRLGNIESLEILTRATLLDPRFKKIHFNDPITSTNAIQKIKSLLNKDNQSISPEVLPQPTSVPSSCIWDYHKQLLDKTALNSTQDPNSLPLDFKLYLSDPVASFNTNPLEYWNKYNGTSSSLGKIAERYLCVVATSVPSERLFSKAGQIMTAGRNRLSSKNLIKLTFLHCLDENDWSF